MGDELSYWPEAQRMAAGQEPEISSPLWPPLYPRFLSALIFVFGAEMLVIEIVQTLMLFVVVLVIWDLTYAWTGSAVAAASAAAMAAIYPPLAAFSHYVWPEILHLFLFLAALWILVRKAPSASGLCTAGILLGLAVETKSLLIPFLPILLLPVLAGSVRQAARRAALVSLGLGLVLVSARLADAPNPPVVGSAATFNVWVGLNDRTRKERVDPIVKAEFDEYVRSAATLPDRNAILRRKIRDKIRQEGVLGILRKQLSRQYFRLFDKDSFLTVQLRGKVLHPAAAGYQDPPGALAGFLAGASFLLYATVLAGAVLGIAVCPLTRRRWLWVVLAFLAYNLALYLFVHVKSRYRIQFLPFLFVYSGCAIAWLAAKLGWSADESEVWVKKNLSRAQSAVTAAAAALLLFLAFGGPLLD